MGQVVTPYRIRVPFQIGVAESRFVKPLVKTSKVGSRLLMEGCPVNWKVTSCV